MLNLLRQINDQDYQSLITQVELASNNYELYFIIDADLINNYCYPKGIIPENTRRERAIKVSSEEFIADEQITLHTLFYLNDNRKRILLLNQYYFELEGMLYVATKEGKKALKKSNINFENFKMSNSSDALLNMLYGSFSKMFAKILLKVNGLKKVAKIINDKRIILDSNDLGDEKLKKITDSNLGSTKHTEIIEKTMIEVLNKENKENFDLYDSNKRDALIIDRVISFNRSCQKSSKENNKKIFILLSDSSLDKETLSRLHKKRNMYPTINGKVVSFHRNVPQTFAYLVCLSYTKPNEINYKKTLENLKLLRKANNDLNQRFNQTSEILDLEKDELLNKDIFVNYGKLRNAFENSGLLTSFEPLYKSVKNEMRMKGLEDIAKIFDHLKNDGKNLFKQIEEKHLTLLHKLKNTANFNTAFILGINRIREYDATFDLSKGADYVEGVYHHLPFFITFRNDKNGYKNLVNEFIALLLSHQIEDSKRLCDNLELIIEEMSSSNLYQNDKINVNLIKALIFMILPSQNSDSGIKENDLLAYKWLTELNINEYEDIEAYKNKLYLSIWSARRVKKYKESITLSKKGIEKFPEDPRFYHGYFLSSYCIIEDNNGKINTKTIDNLIFRLELSFEKYPSFIRQNFIKEHIKSSLKKSLEQTYFNSYTYVLSMKAEIQLKNNNQDSFDTTISLARTKFNLLKESNGIYIEELPEYYDTEAYLEYLESFSSNNLNKKRKLEYALDAISKSIKLSSNNTLLIKYSSRAKLIENRLNDLKTKQHNDDVTW